MNIDFLSSLHKSTKRDYLARVNDRTYPKHKAAKLAKKWSFDYWDGSRKINYGGYKYIPGRWNKVIKKMKKIYKLKENVKILDIGCGKGFFLKDFKILFPKSEVHGLDISRYAINKAPKDIPVKEKILRRTIKTITLPTLPIPKILRMVRRKSRLKAVGKRGQGEKTERYEPIPARAKEHLRRRLSHNPSPATVPVRGPKVLSR